ncbi:hypothetical protein PIB30_115379, partial [Stylosanthes scabra]|nr:hypothetical protein [Stylosanthes scabra]
LRRLRSLRSLPPLRLHDLRRRLLPFPCRWIVLPRGSSRRLHAARTPDRCRRRPRRALLLRVSRPGLRSRLRCRRRDRTDRRFHPWRSWITGDPASPAGESPEATQG